jgi:MFS family permease
MSKRRSSSSLWSNRSFVLYYLFNLLSYFGSGMTVVALPLYIYKQTGSPIYTSLVAVFTGLPYLLFGLFAGALADRGNRRAIMVGCSLFSGLMLMSIPIAASITGEASPVHLLAAGLCISSAFVWFDAASHGALLQLVGRAQLVAANSLLTSTDTITRIGSPAVAGFVIYRFGPEWALGIDAACYLISALLILSMSDSLQRKRADVKAAGPAIDEGSLLRKLRSDIKEGLDFIWGQPIIRMLTLLGFGNSSPQTLFKAEFMPAAE